MITSAVIIPQPPRLWYNGANEKEALMRILILNGPNLNLTGRREPEVYGTKSMDEIVAELKEKAAELGAELYEVQSNHEGRLIDELQEAAHRYDGVLLNAGALTHYSYALRDAVAACPIPVGEVHMSDITRREPFRAVDVLEDVCAFRIMGLGAGSYEAGLLMLTEKLKS
ncbi:MAG: 3-dehydroquinate dehydratase [Clostridia bacterium]|nr:3-dehydroquinate dehydratase [Clostridia bacterium]MBQ2517443.1 3-dehydroquinate dehydratase [Clostridia bacterium]